MGRKSEIAKRSSPVRGRKSVAAKTAAKNTSKKVIEPEIVLEEDDDGAIADPLANDDLSVSTEAAVEPLIVEGEATVLEPDLDEDSGEDSTTDSTTPENLVPVRASGARGGRDALETYLRELAQYPALSKEEEHELAVKYLSDKDRAAAYKLVTSNLWLVVKLAREYERAARNLLDLVQEGNIGLMEAVKNFDPYRGVRFPSYATWWVRAYIIRYLIANWRMVKIGTTQAQRKLFFNLKREKDKLEREGFYPAPKLLAEKLNVRESDIVEMEQRLGGSDASLDAPLASEDGGEQTLHGVLTTDGDDVEATVASREAQRIIAQAVDDFLGFLNDREKFIFEQRILHGETTTLQEVSEKLEISRERVRQIEERLRKRLKEFMRERLGDESERFGLGKD